MRVVDKSGNDVGGLTAPDFTLLENGKPQPIAFFGTGRVPVSLAVLLDTSRSMDYGGKLTRARQLLAPLLGVDQGDDNHPDDEIFFVPFTDRIEAFDRVTEGRQVRLPPRGIGSVTGGGTAFYDALASALCHLRAAEERPGHRDHHRRRRSAQPSEPRPAGRADAILERPDLHHRALEDYEYSIFKEGEKTVTLLGEHDIDHPVVVFDRLAKESGAEAFFPHNEEDLKSSIERISAILQAQYTLAYYPHVANRFRRIEVKARRPGVRVLARRGVGRR